MSARRKSITFVEPAHQALVEESEESGLSETDVVNRAVEAYRFLMEMRRAGNEFLVVDSDGAVAKVHFV